jgi:hypothetical protein
MRMRRHARTTSTGPATARWKLDGDRPLRDGILT